MTKAEIEEIEEMIIDGFGTAFMVVSFLSLAAFVVFAFATLPKSGPSAEELCQKRGGFYIKPYRSQGQCFAREAFK